jgi:hypothetical protein
VDEGRRCGEALVQEQRGEHRQQEEGGVVDVDVHFLMGWEDEKGWLDGGLGCIDRGHG